MVLIRESYSSDVSALNFQTSRGCVKSRKMRFVLAGLTRNPLIISIAFPWDSASSAE